MKAISKFFSLAFLGMVLTLTCACSDSNNEEEPQVQLSDISGVWSEYAYLCSDGYFVDISATGYNMYYEFAHPNNFVQYSFDQDGNKEIAKQGKWTFDPNTQTAHIDEPRGWNLDIKFEFAQSSSDEATLYIVGRTQNSNSTVKVKRIKK